MTHLCESIAGLTAHPFDKRLSLTISSLIPSIQTGFIDFGWLLHAQTALLASLSPLQVILHQQKLPLSRKEENAVQHFLEDCVKRLDVCNLIKQAIAEARNRGHQVKLVVEVLDVVNGAYSEARLRRAKKLLVEFREANGRGEEKKEEDILAKVADPEAKETVRENQILKTAHLARKHLRSITEKLLGEDRKLLRRSLRRLGSGDLTTDTEFVKAFDGVRLITAFLLSVVLASVTNKKSLLLIDQNFGGLRYEWSSVMESLQGEVAEEMQRRAKRKGDVCMIWELDQLCVCVKHINDLLDCLLMLKRFPLLEIQQEEIRKAVGQLKRQQEAIEKGLEAMNSQICEVYQQLICTRTKIANMNGRSSVQTGASVKEELKREIGA